MYEPHLTAREEEIQKAVKKATAQRIVHFKAAHKARLAQTQNTQNTQAISGDSDNGVGSGEGQEQEQESNVLTEEEEGMNLGLAEELHMGLKRPALLWFHGGGFALGSVEGDELKASLIANYTGFTVVSVEYSLAPEKPFPAPIDDASVVYRWLSGELPALVGDTPVSD